MNGRLITTMLKAAIVVMFVVGCGEDWPESRSDGLGCSWGSQCEGGVCMVPELAGQPTGWVGGMCSRTCADGECPDDGVCTNLGDGLYCLPRCTETADCRSDYICDTRLSACMPSCDVSGCPAGFACAEDGLCYYDWSGLRPVGSTCESDADCKTGICIKAMENDVFTGWKDGMCTDVCGSKDCDAGASCVVMDGEAWCMQACGEGITCRDGYVCRTDLAACLPDCTQGWICGDGFMCMADGTCEMLIPELAPVGAPCVADSDCAQGWCLEEVDPVTGPTGWTGGACSVPCGGAVGCPSGAACVVLEAAGWCLTPCSGAVCREGYVCDPYLHACLPNCANEGWDCGTQYTCRADGVCATSMP